MRYVKCVPYQLIGGGRGAGAGGEGAWGGQRLEVPVGGGGEEA